MTSSGENQRCQTTTGSAPFLKGSDRYLLLKLQGSYFSEVFCCAVLLQRLTILTEGDVYHYVVNAFLIGAMHVTHHFLKHPPKSFCPSFFFFFLMFL